MDRLKFVWNVPNVLSLVRLALLPVFVVCYFQRAWIGAGAALLLSGLTDLFDGMIARKLNQITEIGKLLDPIADKLTQIAVLLCIVVDTPALIPLAVICLVKEVLQVIGGWILLSKNATIRGSKWFGKVSTFLFYGVMLAVFLWPTMPKPLLAVLIVLVAGMMLFSFFKYLLIYLNIRKEAATTDVKAVPKESK